MACAGGSSGRRSVNADRVYNPNRAYCIPPYLDINQNSTMYVSKEAEKFLYEICSARFPTPLLNSGIFTAEVLRKDDDNYELIKDYILNSQGHKSFGVKMLSILKVSRSTEQLYSTHTDQNLTMMLFHGTKFDVVGDILEQGFRCPVPEPGKMFGSGVYFADRISKSAHYISKGEPYHNQEGYIFICEVQLGTVYNANKSNQSCTRPPNIVMDDGTVIPCDSLMYTGANIPASHMQKKLGNVIWPVGPTVKNPLSKSYSLNYNEYVVYDPSLIKIKYLVNVKITPTHCFEFDGV